jgi:hypothetical protein
MPNYVDLVAGTMPWAGGLVPAVMTFRNVQKNLPQFGLVEAGLIGVVVEGIGFVTITTTLDIWEAHQEDIKAALRNQEPKPGMPAQFWVSLGGAVVYLVVVVSVNAILDDGNITQKVTMGLMSSFGLLGGLMVALRNQLTKKRQAIAQAVAETFEAQKEQKRLDEEERERVWNLQIEREQQQLDFEQRIQEEKLRMDQQIKLKKLEEKSRKLSESSKKLEESYPKVSEPAAKVPETFGKWHDWRKLPESEKKVVSTFESAEQVCETYGVPPKTGGNWLMNAKKLYGDQL